MGHIHRIPPGCSLSIIPIFEIPPPPRLKLQLYAIPPLDPYRRHTPHLLASMLSYRGKRYWIYRRSFVKGGFVWDQRFLTSCFGCYHLLNRSPIQVHRVCRCTGCQGLTCHGRGSATSERLEDREAPWKRVGEEDPQESKTF